MRRLRMVIIGRVQGVGLRPTVVRLARELALTGFVRNDSAGVTLELQGSSPALKTFLERLQTSDKPPLARLAIQDSAPCAVIPDEEAFIIRASRPEGAVCAEVTVDTAVCAACRAEMGDPHDFRYRYPFINCTHCGPRYTIIRSIPYDRPRTTMAPFVLCDRCAAQYRDVTDRRYHAQPVACPSCGPHIWLTDAQGNEWAMGTDATLSQCAALLRMGSVVAIKGLGGFHLAVDAFNQQAVERLRERKHRDYKPFALMAANLEVIARQALLTEEAQGLLRSPESPIVLLPRHSDCTLAPAVAPEVDSLGFMLCATPLHHLLFAEGLEVLVMTSGNISDEPLICDNVQALTRLGQVADAFLMHNRDIYRQVDDSIVHFVGTRPMFLRRSRGVMPTPIRLAQPARQPVLAVGADLKNTFCLAQGDQLICSEHIGDLADAAVYRHFVDSIVHLRGLFDIEPRVVVHDLHPGYISTQFARSLSLPQTSAVQHHWAHVAAVLAEHQQAGPVIGLVADGTGYGTDGTIWGGECLIASLTEFERWGHLRSFTLPGGDRASKEAIRPLMGLLRQVYGRDFGGGAVETLLRTIEPNDAQRDMIAQQLDRGLNCVATSSLGRIFDAVAALLGVGTVNRFDAQLPMALEAWANKSDGPPYPVDFVTQDEGRVILDWSPMVREMVRQRQGGQDPTRMAARFHRTWATAFAQWACLARDRFDLNTVALSGGVFCNRLLTAMTIDQLIARGFEVLVGRQLPANDGCISVGQAAIVCQTYG